MAESFRVKAHQVQDGGLKIVNPHFVFRDVPSEFIGAAVVEATLDTSACHPCGEAMWMMVTA
ncbi:MAG: hypothetical protein RIR17_2153, partial [Planctomycetota bacterium]